MKKLLVLIIWFILISNNQAQEFSTKQITAHEDSLSQMGQSLNNDLNKKNYPRKHSTLNLFAQEIIGIGSGIGLALPSYYLSKDNRLAGSNDKETLVKFSFLSFVIGSGIGVYLIADIENPNISFWETLGYSIIGGGTGFLILNASFDGKNISPIAIISFFILPTLSSMIYASYIADWGNEINTSYNNNAVKSHKDLVERSKLFNIELGKIYF